jgi:hypothetical protein
MPIVPPARRIWDRDETLKLEGTWMEDDEIPFPPTETNVGICMLNCNNVSSKCFFRRRFVEACVPGGKDLIWITL